MRSKAGAGAEGRIEWTTEFSSLPTTPLATRHHYLLPTPKNSHRLGRQSCRRLASRLPFVVRQFGRLAIENDLAIMDEQDPVRHRLDLLAKHECRGTGT